MTDLERVDAEIAACEAYLMAGHTEQMELALLGLTDWRKERAIILAELRNIVIG